MSSSPTFTLPTLEFFASLLAQTNLNAGGKDFEEVAAQVIAARAELSAALQAVSLPHSPEPVVEQ